jgi:predicted RNase H-like nuclease (RuvC/YqgF family)
MGQINFKTNSKLKMLEDIDIDKIIDDAKRPMKQYSKDTYQRKYSNHTHVDFEVFKLKDAIIKQLQEEIKNLKEEIEDLKTDLKSMIEMES